MGLRRGEWLLNRGLGWAAAVVLGGWLAMQAHAGDVVVSQAPGAASVGQYARFELFFTLARDYANPYDADEIAIDVTFTEPDGATRVVPAFYSLDFDVVPGNPERYENGRNAGWKARFAPAKLGVHTYAITAKDASGTETVAGAAPFTCVARDAKGFLRVDTKDPELLRHETGEPYLPIGHNVGWAPNDTGLAWWARHLDACAAAGVNWARVWMCPFGGGQNLEWSSTRGPYWRGVGRLSPEIAFKLDNIVEMAEARGIFIQLVLQHHGQVSTRTNPNWNENPYNKANAATDGGWLEAPKDFFTDTEARRLTRNRYRYIVARWGYSTAIHCWELWNEVQWTDGWIKNRDSVVAWHEEMARYVREIDSFDHLITTSSDYVHFNEVWALPEIELVQMHTYTASVLPAMRNAVERLQRYGKPVLIAEYGLQAEGVIPEFHPESQPEPQRSQIEDALHLHNGIWAAFHLKSGGHLWWWDHYIEARNLFTVYTPLSLYARGEDPAAEGMARSAVHITTPGGDGIVDAFAMAGAARALLWIYDTGSQYGETDHGTISGATLRMNMPEGAYAIEFWRTRGEGGVASTATATSAEGTLTLAIPEFQRDVAVKVMRRVEPASH